MNPEPTDIGIHQQSEVSLLEDIRDFHMNLPWLHRIDHKTEEILPDGNVRPISLRIVMDDPDGEEGVDTEVYIITGADVLAAFTKASQTVELCCYTDILDYGLGMGCASDVDAILQIACYGAVIFA